MRALEWLRRNPGIKNITEMLDALDIHTYGPMSEVLKELAAEKVIMLSTRYSMLSADWASHVELSVNDWLTHTAFEQAAAWPKELQQRKDADNCDSTDPDR